MRICFDLDNTICSSTNDYSASTLKSEFRDLIVSLKNQGHIIIIYTARRMGTHSGNVGKVVAEIGALTLQQLKDWDIPYDEIYFGKPAAELYVDDKAVNALDLTHLQETINGILNH
jgi:capsule biosynthesis phosphatase